ncbi:MAG TPA: amino acid ABC transporter ATP-binding protein [Candidatus Pullichristensenella avicola]|nr:amino acid ABC transporter ATP-binding protein [Candidatus Pullichristensenella avicola]
MLEVTGLSKHFGDLEVIRDISFSLEKGESLAIIGSSGSGKTTLLRCLTALETPDTGVIRVSGDTVFDASQPRPKGAQARVNQMHFGLVFQSFNLFPQYTALRNVTLAAELLAKEREDYKADKKRILAEILEKGRAALESVGLSAKADNYPHQLSGGQQQRVAIARALMLQPDILCFDEPTSALDPELTGEVLNVIRGLADRDTTMLIVTHEMQFARQVADNVLFMDGGVIVEYGRAEDVIGNPREERTRQFLERYSSERYSSNP